MNNNNNNNNSSMSLGTILGIIFIVLKLCGVIHWSWVWVLSPFWIGLAITLVTLIIIAIIKKKNEDDFWKVHKG